MADGGMARRREAALRLPPLADGRHDPVLERTRRQTCHICGHRGSGMAMVFGKWMCRDRVDCYQRIRTGR